MPRTKNVIGNHPRIMDLVSIHLVNTLFERVVRAAFGGRIEYERCSLRAYHFDGISVRETHELDGKVFGFVSSPRGVCGGVCGR